MVLKCLEGKDGFLYFPVFLFSNSFPNLLPTGHSCLVPLFLWLSAPLIPKPRPFIQSMTHTLPGS